jgi:hypothetical protein
MDKEIIFPYYKNVKRIPRKLKKRIKAYCWVHWSSLTNEQRMWYYLGKINPKFKSFLLMELCKQDGQRKNN